MEVNRRYYIGLTSSIHLPLSVLKNPARLGWSPTPLLEASTALSGTVMMQAPTHLAVLQMEGAPSKLPKERLLERLEAGTMAREEMQVNETLTPEMVVVCTSKCPLLVDMNKPKRAGGHLGGDMDTVQRVEGSDNVSSDTDEAPWNSDADNTLSSTESSKRSRLSTRQVYSGEEDAPARKKRDGATKLYINGYELTRATITQVKISYRCSFYRSQGCKAKLEFIAARMEYDFANSIPHTCVPPVMQALAANEAAGVQDVTIAMKREVDRLATTSVATPVQVWDEVSAKFYRATEHNVAIRGLARGQVIRRVHHARALHYGTDVHGRVEVPPLVNCKNSNLLFLQFHHVWANTKNTLDRVIGWANPALLSLLRYENITLFVDGTFRCVPDTFTQCIVLMVFDRGTKLYIPIFFVLCTSKTYDTYWNVFQFVSNACGEDIKPKEIVCDFETALINSLSDRFPSAAIIGCLFHFKQACRRSMVKHRIHEDQIRIAMRRGFLDMLTVVERDIIASKAVPWVQDAIEKQCVQESIPYSATKWVSFWKYFERTWLKLLPPKFWNVHGYSNTVVARTNNPLERFNRELNAAFGTPHPSLPRFIQTVEDISRRRVQLRDDINLGRAMPPRRTERYELPTPFALDDEAGSTVEYVDAIMYAVILCDLVLVSFPIKQTGHVTYS